MKPLQGKRILDLTNVLAGPFCTYQLANLGAEVLKIETPVKGDLARNLGADPDLNSKGMGISFLAQNSGKKSITLNLKSKKGKILFRELVSEYDAVVENFRPGVMKRLDLSYESLKKNNSNLIYCAITGFGQDGPLSQNPAYDQIIQGLSGVMTITGDSENNPFRVGYPISDTIGGLTAAMALSAALNAPKGGSFIDVSMLEATLVTMGWVISNYLIGGVIPKAQGNENFTSSPSGSFQAKDGLLNIAANKDEQWELLANHLGRKDLIENPDFSNREMRKKNRLRLKAELETILTTKLVEEWVEELNKISVPAGPVLSIPEVLSHPQITKRGILTTLENIPGVEKSIDVLKAAVLFDGDHHQIDSNPPLLGADNTSVYSSLGLGEEEINQLKKEGVI
ncbi:CoA transferase [Hyphomicrobiales bacterium]|jgi:formyl-CoA transferase|nr:CoA transferase [Hyphomicrobiales bacterium]MDG1152607.1 CaiB/BaiF CoA-transferase family protein [Hyphomicrobiales bacterium]MDG1523282.1 CaiB/BaiF CoA-transferase family protein [Hyphomicrobiales bacterium]MDG1664297.1 CaiB/BaiF CoA-transferase family protein [Hyphomicrobiales bacterium]MDG2413798.1 CaiB/BaiF CoA-transferase family protein [Hyphomicrobiales bacterium]|tara:strand:- start:1989 stop:3179 length:1191 start_codon:yes stop_codon:yes gene_type:complete